MSSRTPRRREFAAKDLDGFANHLEAWAAELRSITSEMRTKKVRTVAIDGGKQPTVAESTISLFVGKARGALTRAGTLTEA